MQVDTPSAPQPSAEPAVVAQLAAEPSSGSIARRHDLDALRAIAMLAGIVLHAMLAYVPGMGEGWPVQDVHQHGAFGIAIGSLHGFRMQLFFLISGFFTAMLWRKRGLSALLSQRAKRILLPLAIGMVTIIPVTWFAVIWSATHSQQRLTNIANVGVSDTDKQSVSEPDVKPTEKPGDPIAYMAANLIGTQQSEFVTGMTKLILVLGVIPVFHHLWFLWSLCLLVVAFAMYATLLRKLGIQSFADRLIVSPLRYTWLIPLTLLPQSCMGLIYPSFGPDTAPGLVPFPWLLFYYGIFFFFGAMYFDCDDQSGRLGRHWRLTLPLALVIVFPIGFEFAKGGFGFADQVPETYHRPITVVAQVLYAWLMTFGLMGMFRSLFSRESKTMRYISDSSYWLYLAHLPLIFVLQAVLCDWPLPAIVKCVLITVVCCLLLLASYQLLVRHTPIGWLLNGRRKRKPAEGQIPVATSVPR